MNIWIINHYAMPPEYEVRVRNNVMAKYLNLSGHKVKIISASTIHNTDINLMDNEPKKVIERSYEDLDFIHIKTSNYEGSRIKRIINHLQFPIRLLMNYKKISLKPDVIVCDLGVLFALSPLFIAKKLRVKFILEVRDLWPESIVGLLRLSKNNPFIKILYSVEKYVYRKSDSLIFTMPGGKDYIKDRSWDTILDMSKIHNITNGVDTKVYKENIVDYPLEDRELENPDTFKVIYTGSIRLANDVEAIINAAKKVKELSSKIIFIIYGEGSDKEALIRKCANEEIDNVVFKGQVDKKYIPYILSRSDLNILHCKPTPTFRYGGSLNKLSEYIVSGKPILSTIQMSYNPITKYNCGIVTEDSSANQIAKGVMYFYSMGENEYKIYCDNALTAAKSLDYRTLTSELEDILMHGNSSL
ncbi:glycosyltransferase WbuB [Sporosarcina sp. P20a]|uniref:glycosyltransferase family 4 protein n=1 Tax=Sporosarcina sp. P20a TaxID=2048256 RepID=UPI000C16B0F5|nr:glycosyltransferase family 4 protein [Sporosarcina sp. P20a]PIC85456.1 glycosyltransferase WbuB [Sporosarcina sp. P20a]